LLSLYLYLYLYLSPSWRTGALKDFIEPCGIPLSQVYKYNSGDNAAAAAAYTALLQVLVESLPSNSMCTWNRTFDGSIHPLLYLSLFLLQLLSPWFENIIAQASSPATLDGCVDLVLLGTGADGHCAALYPGSPELAATGSGKMVLAKADGETVTVSIDFINRAGKVCHCSARSLSLSLSLSLSDDTVLYLQ
jgi:hypothetical protein